jgi:outer membrane protein OmpA-like peptidoglycan-associated protein
MAEQDRLEDSADSVSTEVAVPLRTQRWRDSWMVKGIWEVTLILIGSALTLLAQFVVAYYTHQADARADFVKRQLDTWVESLFVLDRAMPRPEMDLRGLIERSKLGLFLDSNTIQELSKAYGDGDKCYNNFSKKCLSIIAAQENIIRKGLNLPAVPLDSLTDFLSGGDQTERLGSWLRNGGGDSGYPTPDETPPPPSPTPVAESQPPAPVSRAYLVYFFWGESTLTDRAKQIIKEAAENSTKVQYSTIEVNGHTDTSGSPQDNQNLSVQHAQAVADELVLDGVPKSAITIQGFGATRPLVATGPGVREAQNRRVEILIK